MNNINTKDIRKIMRQLCCYYRIKTHSKHGWIKGEFKPILNDILNAYDAMETKLKKYESALTRIYNEAIDNKIAAIASDALHEKKVILS